MKLIRRFMKWGHTRTKLETVGWCLWAIGLAVFACVLDPVAAALGYILLLICMSISIKSHKGTITLILISSLLMLPLRPIQSQPDPKPEVVECNGYIIGGVVLVVGGIIIYKLVQFCKKVFPPPAPPPPPPPTPPGTNGPGTNAAPSGNFRGVNLTPSSKPAAYNIAPYGFMDNTVPSQPVPFEDLIIVQFNSSTNLTDWTNCCTVKLWLSSNSVETVVYDSTGTAVCTNYCAGNPYSTVLTNNLPFPLYHPNQPRQFWRDY